LTNFPQSPYLDFSRGREREGEGKAWEDGEETERGGDVGDRKSGRGGATKRKII